MPDVSYGGGREREKERGERERSDERSDAATSSKKPFSSKVPKTGN